MATEIRSLKSATSTGAHKNAFNGVIAGGITGAIEICITFPTEYVKTQLQLDERSAKPRYSGITDVIRQTIKSRGFFGLYRGFAVLFYGSAPKTAIRFGAFEALKKIFADENANLSPVSRLFCGLGAGIAEAIFADIAVETVKVKFIDDQLRAKPKYKGFFHGIGVIIREEGGKGVYKGVTATIIKQGSNQAIRFYTVETMKSWYTAGDPNKRINNLIVGCFGAIGGALSVFVNNPIDVIKTRMQGLEAIKYKGPFHCFYQIAKYEGLPAFYKGIIPRQFRVCLEVAISFMIYDSLSDLLNKPR
ncbi:Tricarboxylate transport protein-like protein [Dinothrombium tinctorium]|uniref:Citrate transport protein n=1 Tax=Dinothrombium tinctorium TaxID=1965070 RepID=A0A3S3PEL2_9ACAR|nr:Tricarboxylate transport protein-like protein [Dinothrombium tinctorium]RWS13677.1 Tricarboxylate transport protein-like protein [Dinothrombium tinctorium]